MYVLWDIPYVKDWHYNGFDIESYCPDSKVHGANMGPTWGWQDPGGPHGGPMIVAIWVVLEMEYFGQTGSIS